MARALEVLGERWTLLIVRELMCGSTGYNQIRRGIPAIPRDTLTKRLRALERADIVIKHVSPAKSSYLLTEAGEALGPLLASLAGWSLKWDNRGLLPEHLDPEALLWDIQRRIDPEAAPEGRVVVEFTLTDRPANSPPNVAGSNRRPPRAMSNRRWIRTRPIHHDVDPNAGSLVARRDRLGRRCRIWSVQRLGSIESHPGILDLVPRLRSGASRTVGGRMKAGPGCGQPELAQVAHTTVGGSRLSMAWRLAIRSPTMRVETTALTTFDVLERSR